MKHKVLCTSVLIAAFLFFFPYSVFGQDSSNYFMVKAGLYSPTGDLDDDDFDDGFNGELSFGHYFSPHCSLEGAIGYITTDMSETEPGFPPINIDVDILAVPLTLTAKGIYPINNIEFYGGAGIGIYLWKAELDGSAGAVSDSDDDGGAEFGFHIMAGVNFNISDNLFLGIEAKHIWTGEVTAEFELVGFPVEEEADLNGFTITGLIGFRF
jgi:opacity protein-like surface antigen